MSNKLDTRQARKSINPVSKQQPSSIVFNPEEVERRN